MTEWVENDYPTEAALKRIRKWDPMDAAGALDFVASIWNWPEFGVSSVLRPEEAAVVGAEGGERYLRLATGGWSGNEDIVGALRANRILSAFTWKLTASGGLHIYEYPACQAKPASVERA
jgi:hypothetical protein